jgi:hypothetical protein
MMMAQAITMRINRSPVSYRFLTPTIKTFRKGTVIIWTRHPRKLNLKKLAGPKPKRFSDYPPELAGFDVSGLPSLSQDLMVIREIEAPATLHAAEEAVLWLSNNN